MRLPIADKVPSLLRVWQAYEVHDALALKRLLWLQEPHHLPGREPAETSCLLPASFDASSDHDDGGALSRSAALGAVAVHADTLALIMFTSGSTSTPKPVPFTHGQLLWSLEHNQQQVSRFPEALSVPGAGTLSFLPNFHVIGFVNNITVLLQVWAYRNNK